MDSYSLSEQETAAFVAAVAALKVLNPESQYKVLRKLAHDSGRELVKPGAVRVAAARAAAGAQRAGSSRATVSSTNPKGRKKDPEYEVAKTKFFATDEGKALIQQREELKEGIPKGKDVPVELRSKVSAISLAIRKGIDSFRNSKGMAVPAPAPSADAKTN